MLVLALFVVAIPGLTESGKVEVQLGPERFDAGPADARAAEVAERGPILLADVAGNQRDVFLQHTGSDAAVGWLAFDARKPGTTRECTLEWQVDTSAFVDPCDDSVVDARGEGLTQYSVEVSDDGYVIVDLREGQ